MNQAEIRLAPMTAELYHSFFREYEKDPDVFLPGQAYFSYTYSEEKVEAYIRRQKELNRIPLAIFRGDEVVGEIIITNTEVTVMIEEKS